ncbi:YraN family protein [Gaiella sp.]|uniref:YraN family protein n=1 Tax=Gaiella sp. TaxID=2663207 RepID=UPI0032678A08
MNAGERRALWHYRLRGYRILGTNVRAGRNEIDLIVRRGRELTFVEVKERRAPGFGGAIGAVDAEKRRRVRRAARIWLSRNPQAGDIRIGFDVVAVDEGRLTRVASSLSED